MRKYILIFLPVILLGSGCMQTVTVPVMKPAPLHIGNHIQTIAIVDRTTPEDRLLSRAESILTGGMPGLDREGAQRAIDGLMHTLQESPRFEVVRTGESFRTPSLRGNWPDPLGWNVVEQLSEDYGSDAVISLEAFNSDFIITDGSRIVEQRESDGNTIETTEFYAKGVAKVKLGFRLYDPTNRSITDAHMFEHQAAWNATGSSLQDALAHLINHHQAVIDTGYESGNIYAQRISPQWITVRREFFQRGGNDAFQLGVRRAKVNDWSGATDAWYQSVQSSDRKTAGRSAFNLALMYEINGDLNMAREWARTSYTDYGIGKAQRYVSALEQRIAQQVRVDEQMR